MPLREAVRFVHDVAHNDAQLADYAALTLDALVLRAKREGYDFEAEDLSAVRAALEANVILEVDKDPFDGSASLWERMWGRSHLAYVVDACVRDRDEETLWQIVNPGNGANHG